MSQTKTQLVEGLDLASAPADSLVIDSSGRVLIGTTTEGEANADDLTVASSGHTGITIRSGTTNRGNIYFSDATSGTGEYAGYIQYNHNGNTLSLGTDTSTRLFINGSGDVGVNTTTFGSSAKFEVKSTTGSITSATSRINGGGTTTGAINTGASLLFAGHDGVNGRDFASLFAGKENGTSGNHDAYLAFGTRVNSGTLTEKLRITSAGRVGIGTSSPSSALNVVAQSDTAGGDGITLGNSTGNRKWLTRFGTNTDLGLYQDFWDGATWSTKLALTYTGRLGIGTTSPIRPLSVSNGGAEGFEFGPGDGAGYNLTLHYNRSTSAYIGSVNQASYHTWSAGTASEKMRLDTSGRLLVGTSSSATSSTAQYALLQVKGHYQGSSAEGIIDIQRGESSSAMSSGDKIGNLLFTDKDGGDYARIEAYADAAPGTNDFPGRLSFWTTADNASSPTERMRINNTGTVIINDYGSANNNYLLDIGYSPSNKGCLYLKNFAYYSSQHALVINDEDTNNARTMSDVRFERNGTEVGFIKINPSSVTYSTTSDYRVKENVVPLFDATNRLKQLQPKRFNFISDPERTVDGFIAHEAQAVVPEAVSGVKDETKALGNITDDSGKIIAFDTDEPLPEHLQEGHTWTETHRIDVHQGIDQAKLVPLLTAALQEAIAKIETLEANNIALETRLAALEAN